MPLDIVIFGVIAVFLIFRFLGVLGQDDKDDGRPRRDSFGDYRKRVEADKARRADQRPAKIVAKQGADKTSSVTVPKARDAVRSAGAKDGLQDSLQKPLDAKASIDASQASDQASMDDKAFLEGAKAAFAMILEAYSDGDVARLSSLIARGELLSGMLEDVAKREKAGNRLAISLHEIMESKITGRGSDAGYEYITVDFVSKQCHLEFDKDNKLIDGDPDVEEDLTDSWTFRQPHGSPDPTWFLCATRSKGAGRAGRNASKKPSKKLSEKSGKGSGKGSGKSAA